MTSMLPQKFECTNSTFSGDSGAAMVLTTTGEVVGMNVELISALPDFTERRRCESVEASLDDLLSAVNSVASHPSRQCVMMRVDAMDLS